MKTITTVTTTAKGKLPYHFICNYCGCRNDKLAAAPNDPDKLPVIDA